MNDLGQQIRRSDDASGLGGHRAYGSIDSSSHSSDAGDAAFRAKELDPSIERQIGGD